METRFFSLPPNAPIPRDWHNDLHLSSQQLEHTAAKLIGEAEDAFNLNPGLTEQIVEPKDITMNYGGDGQNGRPLIVGYSLGLKTIPPGVPDSFTDPQKDLTRMVISEATELTKEEIYPGQNCQQQTYYDSLLDYVAGAGAQPDVHEAGTIATALVYDSAGKTQLLNAFMNTVTDPSVRDKVFYSLAMQSAKNSNSSCIADYLNHISTPAKKELARQAVDAALVHKVAHYSKDLSLHATESYIKAISDTDIRVWARELFGPKVIARKQERKRQDAAANAAIQRARMLSLMG
ncbi:hypothetical protein A3F37_03510 [Candidatus Saccharibacteria bacterium RIFCSPHIGHO2_12_FULL_41_12]|nr:MAG: hypothetical protein A3F37_03510 [Candidatus Saccharibacteria bacterium RIFCSPHIGHO2_12_FULL_41_12]